MAKDKLGLSAPEQTMPIIHDDMVSDMGGDLARIEAFRQDHEQGKLPNLPNRPGKKSCWVSLMHQEDTPYRRQRHGWSFMSPADVPDYNAALFPASGNTAAPVDRIQVQEMVAMEIDIRLYAEFMRINHVERPDQEADKIRARIEQTQHMVQEARLGQVVESQALMEMRQHQKAPDFAAEEARRTV